MYSIQVSLSLIQYTVLLTTGQYTVLLNPGQYSVLLTPGQYSVVLNPPPPPPPHTQSQHSHLVIQQLLGHLDANSKSTATVRAGIVEVLSEAAVIEASGSVGECVCVCVFVGRGVI